MRNQIVQAVRWASSLSLNVDSQQVCSSRDIFQVRLDHFYKELIKKQFHESEVALLTAITGEIGNNCFDHNLGRWRDVSGCWFGYGFEQKHIGLVISDRGQGVLASLKFVVPELKSDEQALDMAFTKKLSGRSPEKRGNGLKFVRSVINGSKNRFLIFISGSGRVSFGKIEVDSFEKMAEPIKSLNCPGTFAFILWSENK